MNRRRNDALEYDPADTAFARGVKEIAHLRGLSTPKLAEVLGLKWQTQVTATLESARPHLGTAKDWSAGLDISPGYLCLLARGLTEEPGPASYAAAAAHFFALVDDADEYLPDGRERIHARLTAAADAVVERVLFEAYRMEMRGRAMEELGFPNEARREPPAIAVKHALAAGGIDVREFAKIFPDDYFAGMFIFLTGFESRAEALRDIVRRRAILQALGTYRPALGVRLKNMLAELGLAELVPLFSGEKDTK